MKNGKRHATLLAALGFILVIGASKPASASEHGRVVIQVGWPVRPVAVVQHRQWIPGHYETRTEQVLVEPGHYQREWVPPVYTTQRGKWGRTYRVQVRDGYYRDVWVEPIYETRIVKFWVPGCYVPVASPRGPHQPMIKHPTAKRPAITRPGKQHPVVTRPAPRPSVGFHVSARF